jgi:glutamate synthase (NADPH/NADH) small chain
MENNELKPKKEKVPRHKMPEQEPAARVKNFTEVPIGYAAETAIAEAKRCIQCKKPSCMAGCPVDVDIPEFIRLVSEGRFIEAALKLKETNALPAVCGRVCPQEEALLVRVSTADGINGQKCEYRLITNIGRITQRESKLF